MKSHEGTSTNKPPLFDGTNFSLWKVRMRTYIMALGVDVWDVVETGYTLMQPEKNSVAEQ